MGRLCEERESVLKSYFESWSFLEAASSKLLGTGFTGGRNSFAYPLAGQPSSSGWSEYVGQLQEIPEY